ncbi:hypothetical protein [Snodgrassella sp. CFCC 13594]|uniref:hypothetical protein n=1 Tax=Snodgrassella sp. CFCC 13594 TaxID=1775559 RepID=UPI000830B997|nr:hypothetical protein [Snodgrassella sp. CFCC 13594]
MTTNQHRMWYWLGALPIALLLSATPTACEPQPAAAYPRTETPSAIMARLDAEAAAQVRATERAYAAMPDAEKTLGDAEVQP